MEVITYENLYELMRKEKSENELQKLEGNLFEKVVAYLGEKRKILESPQEKSGVFSTAEVQRTKRQLENVQKILKELHERRESKIIQLALFSSRAKDNIDMSRMLEQERKLFEDLLSLLAAHKRDTLLNILSEKIPTTPEKPKELKTNGLGGRKVRFIQPVPRFVGDNLDVYGPFEEESIAEIPPKIAEFLIKNKKAEGL